MKVTWKTAEGAFTADVKAGETLKDAAMAAGVPGILGECGGCLSCATCHVVVDPDWFGLTGGPGGMEDAMLDVTLVPREAASRLSCQIEMRPELDGIVLTVPDA